MVCSPLGAPAMAVWFDPACEASQQAIFIHESGWHTSPTAYSVHLGIVTVVSASQSQDMVLCGPSVLHLQMRYRRSRLLQNRPCSCRGPHEGECCCCSASKRRNAAWQDSVSHSSSGLASSDAWVSALGCCAGAVRALERVADKALQLGEAALSGYRSHSSSQCKNAALLHYAVSTWPLHVSRGCKAAV